MYVLYSALIMMPVMHFFHDFLLCFITIIFFVWSTMEPGCWTRLFYNVGDCVLISFELNIVFRCFCMQCSDDKCITKFRYVICYFISSHQLQTAVVNRLL